MVRRDPSSFSGWTLAAGAGGAGPRWLSLDAGAVPRIGVTAGTAQTQQPAAVDIGAAREIERNAGRAPVFDGEPLLQRCRIELEATEIIGEDDHAVTGEAVGAGQQQRDE